MTLFAKKIKTTADHHAAFKKAITDAIKAAIKAGVPLGLIHGEFENCAADFRRAEESRAERVVPTRCRRCLTPRPTYRLTRMAKRRALRNDAWLKNFASNSGISSSRQQARRT